MIEMRIPSWIKFNEEHPELLDLPDVAGFPVNELVDVVEEVKERHSTEMVTLANPDFEQQLTDLAWFMVGKEIDDRLAARVSYWCTENRKYHGGRFNEIGQVSSLLRYSGPDMRVLRENKLMEAFAEDLGPFNFAAGVVAKCLEKLDRGAVLMDSLVSGFNLSRPAGALTRSFLDECLARRRAGESFEALYSDVIEPHAYPYFCFGYYDEGLDVGLEPSAGFLILVNVDPRLRGLGFAGDLVQESLRHYRDNDFKHVFAFGRLASMRGNYTDKWAAKDDLQNYVGLTREKDGLHPDHTVRFHQRAGGEIICGLPISCLDNESCNHSFFVIYDLEKLDREGKLDDSPDKTC